MLTTRCAIVLSILASSCLMAGLGGVAQAAPVWLCKPGLANNPCTTDPAVTSVFADGTSRTVSPGVEPRRKPVDCFYVYPTVSLQTTLNADRSIDPAQRAVALLQASRYSSTCRMWAPIYRQVTVKAIFSGGFTAERLAIAYRDVVAAWRSYLRKHNRGRGVVLLSHSQGTGMLRRLVREEIDPKPRVRKRLVSALLLGGDVTVHKGSDRGGDFQNVPACRSARQTGCVIAYSAFYRQPPVTSLFGRVSDRYVGPRRDRSKLEVLCTNPAALAGGRRRLEPLFSGTEGWITYPGLYSARCRNTQGASWLQVFDDGAATDPRPRVTESLGAPWGLHLVDPNIALGDLTRVVARQSAAWVKANR